MLAKQALALGRAGAQHAKQGNWKAAEALADKSLQFIKERYVLWILLHMAILTYINLSDSVHNAPDPIHALRNKLDILHYWDDEAMLQC